jgi:hypothetical protein
MNGKSGGKADVTSTVTKMPYQMRRTHDLSEFFSSCGGSSKWADCNPEKVVLAKCADDGESVHGMEFDVCSSGGRRVG